MRRQLVNIEYPEHGTGYTLPRMYLIMESYPDRFVGIDVEEYIRTGKVKDSYRSLKMSKIPHRGMTTISFPILNKDLDFPYPREEKMDKIAEGFKRSHKRVAF